MWPSCRDLWGMRFHYTGASLEPVLGSLKTNIRAIHIYVFIYTWQPTTLVKKDQCFFALFSVQQNAWTSGRKNSSPHVTGRGALLRRYWVRFTIELWVFNHNGIPCDTRFSVIVSVCFKTKLGFGNKHAIRNSVRCFSKPQWLSSGFINILHNFL